MDRPYVDFPEDASASARVRRRDHGLTRDLAPTVVRFEPGAVVLALCQAFDLEPHELRCQSRKRRFTEPRSVGYWLLFRHTRLPLCSIARVFGKTDHCTVLFGMKRCEALRERDPWFRERTDRLERELEAKVKGTVAA